MTMPVDTDAREDHPEAIESILDRLETSGAIDLGRQHRVYCNRDLNLATIDAVGFDMDYTLAQYRQEAIEDVTVRKTLERLVRERDYPEDIFAIDPDPEFAIRGLVLDTYRGNIFKIDQHRHVGNVYHGFRELTDEERDEEYRSTTIRFVHDRFALIDTLFALPEAFLYAALVDYLETTEPTREHDWREVYEDLRHCVDLAHRDDSIKNEILDDPGSFLVEDPQLALTLHKFRSAGNSVFLLTNSYPRYTDRIMSHLLDGALPEYPSWRSYFDIAITGANKPEFFVGDSPFLEVDAEGEVHGEVEEGFESGTLYRDGNLEDFESLAGFGGDRVLFIGDHIYGDMLRSKKTSAWRTAMIVQEMEDELRQVREMREELDRIEELDQEIERLNEELTYDKGLEYQIQQLIDRIDEDEELGGELDTYDLERLEATRRKLDHSRREMRDHREELIAELRSVEETFESRFNPYWGLIFKQQNENTIFGEQVEDYACVYTSRVSNFLNYSPTHYFRTLRQPMPHERF